MANYEAFRKKLLSEFPKKIKTKKSPLPKPESGGKPKRVGKKPKYLR